MSDGLVDSVKARIEELEALKQSAESVSGSLENLLALKQQQASVVQAWQSVQQAEEALPLAFMSSIFGMNNKEISGPKAPMSLLQQFKLMFPISVGIVVIVLVFAYSGFVRTLVWLAYRYLIIFTLVKTSPYDRIYLSLDWKSASLTRKVEEKVRDMKLLVKKNKKKRTFNEIKEKREKQRAAEIQEEKLQQEEEAKKKRMDHHANGREGQASDASRNPAALVTPTVSRHRLVRPNARPRSPIRGYILHAAADFASGSPNYISWSADDAELDTRRGGMARNSKIRKGATDD
ncbi:hypothetical protein LA080_002785 [Diaporthe eres]|nr:hypothetical protein LA080_002785 [Diaporthe eres]